jgi:hypothetical protein
MEKADYSALNKPLPEEPSGEIKRLSIEADAEQTHFNSLNRLSNPNGEGDEVVQNISDKSGTDNYVTNLSPEKVAAFRSVIDNSGLTDQQGRTPEQGAAPTSLISPSIIDNEANVEAGTLRTEPLEATQTVDFDEQNFRLNLQNQADFYKEDRKRPARRLIDRLNLNFSPDAQAVQVNGIKLQKLSDDQTQGETAEVFLVYLEQDLAKADKKPVAILKFPHGLATKAKNETNLLHASAGSGSAESYLLTAETTKNTSNPPYFRFQTTDGNSIERRTGILQEYLPTTVSDVTVLMRRTYEDVKKPITERVEAYEAAMSFLTQIITKSIDLPNKNGVLNADHKNDTFRTSAQIDHVKTSDGAEERMNPKVARQAELQIIDLGEAEQINITDIKAKNKAIVQMADLAYQLVYARLTRKRPSDSRTMRDETATASAFKGQLEKQLGGGTRLSSNTNVVFNFVNNWCDKFGDNSSLESKVEVLRSLNLI